MSDTYGNWTLADWQNLTTDDPDMQRFMTPTFSDDTTNPKVAAFRQAMGLDDGSVDAELGHYRESQLQNVLNTGAYYPENARAAWKAMGKYLPDVRPTLSDAEQELATLKDETGVTTEELEAAEEAAVEGFRAQSIVTAYAASACAAEGIPPSACRQAVTATFDWMSGKITNEEWAEKASGLVGAAAGVAACSAAGAAVAAPICAYVGEKLGELTGRGAMYVHGLIKNDVIAKMPGGEELNAIADKAVDTAKSVLEGTWDALTSLF